MKKESKQLFEAFENIITKATRFNGDKLKMNNHELVDTCELYIPLFKLKRKYKFNKGHQPKDEEYPLLADNSKIEL